MNKSFLGVLLRVMALSGQLGADAASRAAGTGLQLAEIFSTKRLRKAVAAAFGLARQGHRNRSKDSTL
jgi:hypothetical protein